MTLWYVNPSSGSDAAAGTSWALACATITGITAKAVVAGDTVRVAKSGDPIDTGLTANWSSGLTKANGSSIGASTSANPCVVTQTAHGLVTGDYVNPSVLYSSLLPVTYLSANTFSLPVMGPLTGTTISKVTNQVVLLSSPVTAVTNSCDTAWTAVSTHVTLALANSLQTREGLGALKATMSTGIAGGSNTLLAYAATAQSDYSSYNQVSFSFYNFSIANLGAGYFSICLCSDTAGATIVNTIAVPAVTTASTYVAFTVDTGSALSNSVQSVAIYYTASVASTAGYVIFDNIIACGPAGNASSLSLTSLISKNNGEGWFNIRSITGNLVCLDTAPSTVPSTGLGYYGTSGTFELWRRETFRQTMMAASSSTTNSLNSVNVIGKNGTAGNPIIYSGGWNPVTNLQDGTGAGANQTFYDGQNGMGSGLSGPFAGTVSYINISGFNFSRFYCGLGGYIGGVTYNNCTVSVQNVTNCAYGVAAGFQFSTVSVGNISFATSDGFSNNATSIAISLMNSTFNLTNVFAVKGNGVSLGANAVSFSPNNVLNISNFIACCNIGILTSLNSTTPYNFAITGTGSSPAPIIGCTTGISLVNAYGAIIKNVALSGNSTTDVAVSNTLAVAMPTYLVDSTYSFTPTVNSVCNDVLYVRNPNATAAAYAYSDAMSCATSTALEHTAGNRSWEITTNRTAAYSNGPALLNLGYVVLQGGVTNTISAWIYSTASGLIGGLQVVGNQLEGMSATALATTTGTVSSWTQVSCVITTATQSGPVMVQAYALSSSGSQSMWIGDLTVA